MTNSIYNAISAWAALLAALAAIYAIWIEGKRSRFAHGLDILARLSDKFRGEDMVSVRRSYASLMLDSTKIEAQDKKNDLEDEILDHFQEVSLLTRRHILDSDLTWAEYGYWFRHYYPLLKNRIKSFREKEDPSGWEDVDWLHCRFQKKDFYTKACTNGEQIPQDKLTDFLNYEARLPDSK